MTTFTAHPGTRIGTRGGTIEFDEDGVFETTDPAMAADVAAALVANPTLVEPVAPAEEAPAEPYAGAKVAELRKALADRGLDTEGRRAELVERLVADDGAQDAAHDGLTVEGETLS